MGSKESKLEISQSKSATHVRSTDNSQKLSRDEDIHRLAIDQSARIGSLYDARKDRLLDKPVLNIPDMSIILTRTEHDPVIDVGILKGKQLPDLIGIDKELCLSIYSKLVDSYGISLLINYPLTIDEHTRFLSYFCSTKQNFPNENQNIIESRDIVQYILASTATHGVTSIVYGIYFVVVLQPSPEDESNIDRLLDKIKKQLTGNTFKIQPNEEDLVNRFTYTKVFSNIPDVAKLTKLTDVCRKITNLSPNISDYPSIKYTLRPIRCLYPSYPQDKVNYVSLRPENMDQMEKYLYQLIFVRRMLKTLDFELKQSLNDLFKSQFIEFQQQRNKIEDMYKLTLGKIRDLVLDIRNGKFQQGILLQPLIDEYDNGLINEIKSAIDRLRTLKEKVQRIKDCKKYNSIYLNIENLPIEQDDTLQIIEQKLLNKHKRKRIYCFDDNFKKANSPQWDNFYRQWINDRESNPQIETVFADFSFCSCRLPQMKILASKDISKPPQSSPNSATSNAASSLPKPNHHAPPSASTVDFINVLLLGESGVGKSTFINAVVNYVRFDTIEKARSNEPVVLMPVSFLMTTGDSFEEQIVRFGGTDPNEDHNHPGQSVTQYCRSYVLDIGNQTKLRLIDTPGMGDTRGLTQDDINMQRILSFINNLPHLNAICILLKPNESRLNVVFRSYFTRLISFLGENVRNNIIFCFTNTRTTFFAPGNTGPLLKKMLESLEIEHIPFKKANTFCFDNEAFRYLIARQNGIAFDEYQKEEYKHSWMTSVKESNRLFKCIRENLKPYSQEEWQSIEHAQFQITQMVRPILEAIRNNIRNNLLLSKNLSKSLIEPHSSPAPKNSANCIGCKRSPVICGEFLVIVDDPHVLSDICQKCHCNFTQHIKLNYILEYKICDKKRRQSLTEMKPNSDQLRRMIKVFVYFFKFDVRMLKANDPILPVLDRMIAEEKINRSKKGTNSLNSNLYDELNSFKKEYEETWTTSGSKQKQYSLSDTYRLIKDVNENPTIKAQMFVIKQTQEEYMMDYETQVS